MLYTAYHMSLVLDGVLFVLLSTFISANSAVDKDTRAPVDNWEQ